MHCRRIWLTICRGRGSECTGEGGRGHPSPTGWRTIRGAGENPRKEWKITQHHISYIYPKRASSENSKKCKTAYRTPFLSKIYRQEMLICGNISYSRNQRGHLNKTVFCHVFLFIVWSHENFYRVGSYVPICFSVFAPLGWVAKNSWNYQTQNISLVPSQVCSKDS